MPTSEEFEQRLSRLEFDVAFVMKYVRELAKIHLSAETIRRLEEEYESCKPAKV